MALPRTGVLMPAGTAGEASRALEEVLLTAQAAERRGFDALLLDGRPPSGGGRWRPFDPFTLLGACAAATSVLRLGALVPITERPASLVAKAVATLDVCSEGRAVLVLAPAGGRRPGGRGGGPASGDVPSAAPTDDLEEALAIVAAMLVAPAATVTGRHLAVRDAWNEPRQPVPPPIAVAVDRPSAGWLADLAGWAAPPDLVLTDRPAPPGALGPVVGAGPGSDRSGPPVLVRRPAPRDAGPASLPPPSVGVIVALGAPVGRVDHGCSPRRSRGTAAPS